MTSISGYPWTGNSVSTGIQSVGTSTKETVEDSAGTHVTEYTYDANFNRISKTVDGVVTSYTYNEINQLVQAGYMTYTYDNAGNLVSQSRNGTLVVSYEYDGFNRLISITGLAAGNQIDASFTYDDNGNRTSKTINGITTNYITDSSSGYSQVLKAITGNETIYYVRGFELISRFDGTDTFYYLTDVMGNVRGHTDESGNITDTCVFDSFGNLNESTGTTTNSYGFQGEEQDETGLIYLRARYMDPETGRFLSMDSYGGNLANPVSQNRYLFANSNPVKFSDPSGHTTVGELLGSMAIITILSASANAIIAGFLYQESITDYSEFSYGEMFKQAGLAFLGGLIVGGLSILATFLVFFLAFTALECMLCMMICGILGFLIDSMVDANFFGDNEIVNQILKYVSQGLYGAGLTFGLAGIAGGGITYGGADDAAGAADDVAGSSAKGAGNTVDDFLSSNVPKQFQTQVKNAFGSDAKVTTLTQDTTVYRYYGGDSAPSSYWVTPNKASNPISELALPPGNTAQYVDTIVLKKGTTVLEGTVAPNFGQAGGGYQYYIPGMK